jgi:chitodextrinase
VSSLLLPRVPGTRARLLGAARFGPALFLAALLLLGLLPSRPAAADLTPDDRARLTKDLQTLSRGWDQPSVEEANLILWKPEYSGADWEKFFGDYFDANPFTTELLGYLVYPVMGWADHAAHQRLQNGLYPILTRKIAAIVAAHAGSLGPDLAADEPLRLTLFNSHRFFWYLIHDDDFDTGTYDRNTLYEFYKAHVLAYPQFFSHAATLDPDSQGWVGGLQVQTVGNFRIAKEVPPRAEVASVLALSGRYLDLWNDFRVLLLDNNGLDQQQLDLIHRYFSVIPTPLALPEVIAVMEELNPPPDRWREAYWDGVNIGTVGIELARENPFPDDAAPRWNSVYFEILAHEANHVVNYHNIELGPAAYRDRQVALIRAAGDDHMNYLRSMVPDGVFTKAPQEFFASIANAWFCDSQNIIELGLTRFNAGRPHPMNQALFFAEIYSTGGDHTWFYTSDEHGALSATEVPVTRDANGHINSLHVGQWLYEFELDAEGNVLAVGKRLSPPAAPTDLRATVLSSRRVRLSWRDHSADETSFELQRKSGDTGFEPIRTLPANTDSFEDRALTSGRTYTYRVRAVSAVGPSGWSSEAVVTPQPALPAAPTGLAAEPRPGRSALLRWQPSPNGLETEVERRLDGGDYAPIGTAGEEQTGYTDLNLAPSTRYWYRIRARNEDGISAYTAAVPVTTLSPPAAPANLAAQATSPVEVTLTWDDRSSNETGFLLERREGAGEWAQVAAPAANERSYLDDGVAPDRSYTYRLRARNLEGESPYSAEASVSTPVPPIAAPSGLQARAESSTRIRLTWNDESDNETGFEIERWNGREFVRIAATGPGAAGFTDADLASNTAYRYRVRAVAEYGASEYAGPVSTKTKNGPPTAPGALVAKAKAGGKIRLTWEDRSNNETEFRLVRKEGAGLFKEVAKLDANTRSYTDPGLTPGRTYSYRLRALNRLGSSPFTSAASARARR